jgi:acetylornithine deacetylase/succinyl-diaminopimelate desuccinylase-like protein
MHLAAVRAMHAGGVELPVNLKLLVDGEEEIGSPSLPRWLEEHRTELDVDLVVVSDTSMLGLDRPSVVMATRGITALEVEVRTLDRDVHSGKFGGGVANAALVLARLLATLHDPTGRVAVAGFYDTVRPLSESERADLEASEPPEAEWLASVGARSEAGDRSTRLAERVWAQPSLDVSGMWSGYTGPGSKTIIPAVATAKLSCRLVADQCPAEIAALVEQHLRERSAGESEVRITASHGGRPVVTPRSSPVIPAAVAAYEWGYGRTPVFIREGGTIPVAATLGEILESPVLFLGFGLHGQQEHAPNEWLSVENFERAVNAIAMFWRLVASAIGSREPSGSHGYPAEPAR